MNKMRDDQEFNINFVKIIEKERCLYDKTLSEYRSKEVHDQIWKRISAEVKESVPHCKERWRNLRACLTRHLKQQLYAADGTVFHKPYYLAEHMKFVLPFTKSRSSCGKETTIYVETSPHTTHETPLKDAKDEALHLTSNDDTVQHQHESKHFQQNETPTYTISTAESDDNNQYVTFVQNANGELTPDPLDENQLHVQENTIIASKGIHHSNYVNASAKSIDIYEPSVKRVRLSHQETDDADLNFFRSLLPDIRMMTASQKRRFKMGIFQLIDNVLKNTDANA